MRNPCSSQKKGRRFFGFAYQTIGPGLIFGWRRRHRRNRSGLFHVRSTKSLPPTLTTKSARRPRHHDTKTIVVVPVVRVVPVTIGAAAIIGMIVPRSAAHPEVPAPPSMPRSREHKEVPLSQQTVHNLSREKMVKGKISVLWYWTLD